MRKLYCIYILFFCVQLVSAQQSTKGTIVTPFKISERYLSGLDIPQVRLKAHPKRMYFQKRIYKGSELSIFILSSETATNTIDKFSIDEYVFYLKGKAEIELQNGEKQTFLSGDHVCVPKGFSGNWTNNGGNQYHLELSVISNKRAPKEAVSTPAKPFLLGEERLSGIGEIPQKHTLFSGVELTMKTVTEKPETKEILKNTQEQFIHVLDGIVTITPKNGKAQIFYRNDFFVLPKGFSGTWKTEAQHTFRMLVVTTT
ncbi:MAG: cupin domain-containing protein [Kordia sp.]|uniref:cupin domain-containing protein n=1 Tax=Kordia sp. TaxID=1965332 RepID=UPI00385D0DEC